MGIRKISLCKCFQVSQKFREFFFFSKIFDYRLDFDSFPTRFRLVSDSTSDSISDLISDSISDSFYDVQIPLRFRLVSDSTPDSISDSFSDATSDSFSTRFRLVIDSLSTRFSSRFPDSFPTRHRVDYLSLGWEETARDRERFQRRIEQVGVILEPVLRKHMKMYPDTYIE